jgi:hypothetical protein
MGRGSPVKHQRVHKCFIGFARRSAFSPEWQFSEERSAEEALAVVMARGLKLWNPNEAPVLKRAGKGSVALRATVSANAAEFGGDLAPLIQEPPDTSRYAPWWRN